MLHNSHVVLDKERERWKERWIGYNRIFCGVCTFHESHVAFLALGNKLRAKPAAEMRNEKFKDNIQSSLWRPILIHSICKWREGGRVKHWRGARH